MNELDLPEPIADYFRADTQEPNAIARCFTSDGVVVDEGRTHTGQAAIEAWKADAAARYTYTARPHRLERDGGQHLVTAQVSGNFPGSPVDLRYRFTLERGRIARLEISP